MSDTHEGIFIQSECSLVATVIAAKWRGSPVKKLEMTRDLVVPTCRVCCGSLVLAAYSAPKAEIDGFTSRQTDGMRASEYW